MVIFATTIWATEHAKEFSLKALTGTEPPLPDGLVVTTPFLHMFRATPWGCSPDGTLMAMQNSRINHGKRKQHTRMADGALFEYAVVPGAAASATVSTIYGHVTK